MIKNNLSKLLKERDISLTELAQATGIHINTLNDLYRSKAKGISRVILGKLCRVLHCNVHDLFEYIPD